MLAVQPAIEKAFSWEYSGTFCQAESGKFSLHYKVERYLMKMDKCILSIGRNRQFVYETGFSVQANTALFQST